MRKTDFVIVILQLIIFAMIFLIREENRKISTPAPSRLEATSSGVCIECPGTKEHLKF